MVRLPDNTPFGEYSIHRFIKAGLFNDNYIVKNPAGTPFFMKFYDVSAMPDKMLQEGLVKEIIHCQIISHPNIIRYVGNGSGKINGRDFQYLVTKFFNGSLLSEVLRDGRTFSVPEAKSIIIPVLQGLVYLHQELKLNHNDLCPRNILLESGPDGVLTPKIIDLAHTHTDVDGAVPFPMEDLNLFYTAPEALKGSFTARSDVFAVSAILYTLLFGRAPWHCHIGAHDSFYSRKISVGRAREAALEFPKNGPADPAMDAILEAGLSLDSAQRPDAATLLRLLAEDFQPGEITLRE
ncbi:MAG: protein kinase, partial [Bacteroidales bacterium]|nr:protein kinase [Bacteroidales bacterium]